MAFNLGKWEILPFQSPLLPVHAVLLPPVQGGNDKILFLSGSRSEEGGNCLDCSAVWDYKNGNSFYRPRTPLLSTGVPFDFFCAGHAILSNGDVLVAGGTLSATPYLGLKETLLFELATQSWKNLPAMAHGRWYPTLLLIDNGDRVLAVGGKDENGLLNEVPEVYTPGVGWKELTSPPTTLYPSYGSFLLLKDKRIFSGGRITGTPRLITLDPDQPKFTVEQPIDGLRNPDIASSANIVFMPPAQDQKVMFIGGYNVSLDVPTARVDVVDLSDAANVSYKPAPSLHYSRMYHQTVILPDRTLFVCGGSRIRNSIPDARLTPELYDPRTDNWKDMAPNTIPRLYHSIALLVPDGRVLVGGSTPRANVRELRLEFYSPPYLFKGPRPVIELTSKNIIYGQTIQIKTPQFINIKWVQLMHPSSVTHSLDVEQRLIDLPFTVNSANGSLQVSVEKNQNIAPAGWYMLFIVDNNDIPSVASWVRLNPRKR